MILVPQQLTRTEQPQDGARLDPANPLARRFAVALLPAVTQANLGFGAPGTLPSHGLARVAMPSAMLATNHTGGSANIATGRLFGPTPTYPVTVILVCRQGSTANTRFVEFNGASGAIGGSHFYIGGGSSTAVTYGLRNNFATSWAITVTVPTPPDGSLTPALNNDMVIVAQSLSATDHRMCVNGSAIGTDTTNSNAMVAWDRLVLGTASGNAQIAAALFASGGAPLTDAQMQQLSRSASEVYALFEPQWMWAPVGSGGVPAFKPAWARGSNVILGAGALR